MALFAYALRSALSRSMMSAGFAKVAQAYDQT
jgi:hypothetical protein